VTPTLKSIGAHTAPMKNKKERGGVAGVGKRYLNLNASKEIYSL